MKVSPVVPRSISRVIGVLGMVAGVLNACGWGSSSEYAKDDCDGETRPLSLLATDDRLEGMGTVGKSLAVGVRR